MRYPLLMISLALLCACRVVSPNPSGTPSATNVAPTLTATLTRVSSSPTSPPPLIPAASATNTSPAVATNQPGVTDFAAALRPGFRGDLSLVPSPTVYRMSLLLDPSLTHLDGKELVTYTNHAQTALAEIYFRLYPNLPDVHGNLTISNIRVNEASVQPKLEVENTALRVPLAQPLASGSTLNILVEFAVTIPISNTGHYAEFTNSEGVAALPEIFPLIPAFDEKGWHIELPPSYGDLTYTESALYDVHLTAPITTTVITSGSTVEKVGQGNEATWHVIAAPIRDFNIDLSPVLQKSSAQVGDISMNSYYLPADAEGGREVLQWASDALRVYEKRIGAYPFRELDLVETSACCGAAAIEYPGAIAVASSLYRDPKGREFFEFAVAHEIAHQWWYSVIGDDQVNTPWMDESLTQYTTYIYERDTHGADFGARIFKGYFRDPYDRAVQQGHDQPIGLPVSAYREEAYVQMIYSKGALFFDEVRHELGDDNFYKFLRSYYQRFKYQNVKPDDLRRTMEEASGKNIDALFDKWVLGK